MVAGSDAKHPPGLLARSRREWQVGAQWAQGPRSPEGQVTAWLRAGSSQGEAVR